MRLASLLALALFASTTLLASVPAYAPSPWERQLVATCLILEASNQGERGMQAVALVIANRARSQPSDYANVVKTPYAFSALNSATKKNLETSASQEAMAVLVRKASKDLNWSKSLAIVDALYENRLSDFTFGADHYTRTDQLPSWSHGMVATAVIGDHLFFRSTRESK